MAYERCQHLADANYVVKGITELLLRYVVKIKGYVQLRTNLPCGTICNVKELHKLGV